MTQQVHLSFYVQEDPGHGCAYYRLCANVLLPGLNGMESKEYLQRIAVQLNQQFDTTQSNQPRELCP